MQFEGTAYCQFQQKMLLIIIMHFGGVAIFQHEKITNILIIMRSVPAFKIYEMSCVQYSHKTTYTSGVLWINLSQSFLGSALGSGQGFLTIFPLL